VFGLVLKWTNLVFLTGLSNIFQDRAPLSMVYSLIVILYIDRLYNKQGEESHEILNLNAIKTFFLDRNAKIFCIIPNCVLIKFSNRFILEVRSILYGGFSNEKVTCS
jgi:hypothetical protein